MTRERRSLWGSISTSRKVNSVSLGAALLYTWAIPHFDDEGFLDGEEEQIRAKIVPLRPEYRGATLKKYILELEKVGLWHFFRGDSRIIIYDPAFDTHQIFHGFKKIPSKLRAYIWQHNPEWLCVSPNRVNGITPLGTRGRNASREVKGSEVKRSEEEIIFISPIKRKKKEKEEIEKKIAEYKEKELQFQAEQLKEKIW